MVKSFRQVFVGTALVLTIASATSLTGCSNDNNFPVWAYQDAQAHTARTVAEHSGYTVIIAEGFDTEWCLILVDSDKTGGISCGDDQFDLTLKRIRYIYSKTEILDAEKIAENVYIVPLPSR